MTLPIAAMQIKNGLTSCRVHLKRTTKQPKRDKVFDIVLLKRLLIDHFRPAALRYRDGLQYRIVLSLKLVAPLMNG